MHRVLLCVEQWLYTNIFKYSFYANISNGITAISSILNQAGPTKSNIKKKNLSFGKSFVDVLELLIGSNVYNYIEKL